MPPGTEILANGGRVANYPTAEEWLVYEHLATKESPGTGRRRIGGVLRQGWHFLRGPDDTSRVECGEGEYPSGRPGAARGEPSDAGHPRRHLLSGWSAPKRSGIQ